VDELLARGHAVTVRTRGGSAPPAGVAQLVADRKDREAMRRALAGQSFDEVYDVSASAQVAPVEDIAALIEMLDGHCGVYEFVSSIAVYRSGNGSFPWDETAPLTRGKPTGYGGHKVAVEALLAARRAATGFPYTVIRPAAVYGPYDNIPDGEMAMFHRLRRRLPVLLPHDGLVCFPYGHVADLARAMVLAAACPAALGEAFNITADAVTSMYYVRTLADIVGVEPEIVMLPDSVSASLKHPLPFNHRFQKIMHAVATCAKAERTFGFVPVFDFARGHRQTYEWFLAEGLDRVDTPMNDPTWNMSWDFEREAAVLATLR
jgi:nucleoside-diphosphate-sugar epimerase